MRRKGKNFLVKDGLLFYREKRRNVDLQVKKNSELAKSLLCCVIQVYGNFLGYFAVAQETLLFQNVSTRGSSSVVTSYAREATYEQLVQEKKINT